MSPAPMMPHLWVRSAAKNRMSFSSEASTSRAKSGTVNTIPGMHAAASVPVPSAKPTLISVLQTPLPNAKRILPFHRRHLRTLVLRATSTLPGQDRPFRMHRLCELRAMRRRVQRPAHAAASRPLSLPGSAGVQTKRTQT